MSIDRYYGPRAPFGLSGHDFWELGCLVRGAAEFRYENGNPLYLKADTVFLIPPGIPHAEWSSIPADMIFISLIGSRMKASLLSVPQAVRNRDLACMIETLWIFTEIEEKGSGPELDAKALEIVAKFLRLFHFSNHPEASDMVERSIAYMHSHLSEPISIPDIAAAMGCSQTYFRRVFKMRTGRTPGTQLQELRMRHAVSFLENTDMSIAEISNAVGYEDPFYFSRIFSKHHGLSPKQFSLSLRAVPWAKAPDPRVERRSRPLSPLR